MTEDATNELVADVPAERVIERITPEGLPITYANNVLLHSSIWDFTMDFGLILEATPSKLKFQDTAKVIMSPQHMAVFAEILADHVRQYEEKFGRIPRPPKDREASNNGAEADAP